MNIDRKIIEMFENYLVENEKASATVEKYVRDVGMFFDWLRKEDVSKAKVLEYKKILVEKYSPASVNAAIASLNCFFDFAHKGEMKIRGLKIQRKIFENREKELTKAEYERLLYAAKAKGNKRLYYLMQTICSTGIRVSELRFITVESLKKGHVRISCKGKMRVVILPKELCNILIKYTKERGIKKGPVFVTKSGKPVDRSNIWSDMKKLCNEARVDVRKVFPHNLRHLFARTYYSIQKDIVRLSDILGHSSINTTRIYTIETGDIHRRQIEKLGLLRC